MYHNYSDDGLIMWKNTRCSHRKTKLRVCVFVQASVPSSAASVTRPSTRRVLCKSTWSNTLERSPSSVRCAASGSRRRATWNTTWRDPMAMVSSWLASHQCTHTHTNKRTLGRTGSCLCSWEPKDSNHLSIVSVNLVNFHSETVFSRAPG